jgi:uncharacterized membrane protein YdbT with pleckstrin-like domain
LVCSAASIGKLRIHVPWKKLGWEPILISLEEVTIRAGPQDDGEVCLLCLFYKLAIYLRALSQVLVLASYVAHLYVSAWQLRSFLFWWLIGSLGDFILLLQLEVWLLIKISTCFALSGTQRHLRGESWRLRKLLWRQQRLRSSQNVFLVRLSME